MTSVVVVRLSAMGDTVQSLGAIAALHAVRPDWRITFVSQRPWAALLDGLPGIERVVAFDRGGGVPALLRLRRELRRDRYDVALDLQGNWKSALVTRSAGARVAIGMAAAWRQEPASGLLLHRTITCDAVPHPARAAWELVRTLAPEAPFRHPRLRATPTEVQAEHARLRAAGVDPDVAFDVFVVTDPADPRALRPEFVRQRIAAAAQPVCLFGPGAAELPCFAGAREVRHRTGDVRALVALGALIGRAGGEVIGPDQGATHVLLAAGAPGTVVFGSQDPRRSAPPGARVLVRTDAPVCQPCRARRCRHPDGVVCMVIEPGSARRVGTGLPPEGAVALRPR